MVCDGSNPSDAHMKSTVDVVRRKAKLVGWVERFESACSRDLSWNPVSATKTLGVRDLVLRSPQVAASSLRISENDKVKD